MERLKRSIMLKQRLAQGSSAVAAPAYITSNGSDRVAKSEK